MIKRVLLIALFFIPCIACAVVFPEPVGFVNDYANILNADQKNELETTIRNFRDQTSTEIAIAIVSSFDGLDRFSYSQELFNRWKIGDVAKNNGVLFVISIRDREAFINVGKGLEGVLPDSYAGSILRAKAFPQFKLGKYYEGILASILEIISASRGEYRISDESTSDFSGFSALGIWFLFIFLSYLGSYLARTKSWWLGGVLGAIGGAILGFLLFSGIVIVITSVVLAVMGLIFDYVVSRNYEDRMRNGKPTDFWRSGGGFWWGGGGRGGFGGGSFGGFGGGGSGGGGAGGSW